ncbi:AI-2E family transporter [Methylocystis echinoides]|uniref:AI-2E family transporter n=1 Tax=Methylocystis echinoides TaxID=29468 RepID=UPI00341722AF
MAEVIVSAIVVVAIVYGREVLMPLSLAAVVAFMLSPAVAWLARFGLPRLLAIVLALSTLVGATLFAATVFSSQIISLTGSLATYKNNLAEKARSLTPTTGGGALQRAIDSLDALQREVEKQTHGPERDEEIRVVVENPREGGVSGVLETVRSVLGPLEMALLTLVYVAVLLAGQYDLVDRVVRLAGVENMSESTAALSTAGERLSSFFLGQGAINLAFGVATGAVLAALGIPNAILWGMAVALLRFIPFIGIFAAAVPPLLLAAAVSPGWGLLLGVLAYFLIAELITSNIVEPVVMGRHVGLSPLAFIAAGSFWWVVWGPVGLLLAAPLTTTLVVLGEFFPSMSFLSLLFGDRPPLTPEQEYYHRLLARDAATAAEALESATRGLPEICDAVVLPALAVATKDFRDRRISAERAQAIADTMREATESVFPVAKPGAETAARTIIIPGLGPIDAAASGLAAAVLSETTGKPCAAVQASTGLLALASLKEEETAPPETLLLFTVGGLARAQMNYMARRAGVLFPETRIMLFEKEEGGPIHAGEEEGRIVRCSSLSRADQLLRLAPQGSP